MEMTLEQYAKRRSKRISTTKNYLVVFAFLFVFIAAFLVFFVYPFFYGIYISLTNFEYGAPGKETFNSFQWYQWIFAPDTNATRKMSECFWHSFANSFVFSVIMVPCAILAPLLLAILINNHPPGYKIFRAIVYMPSIVPLTAAGTIFSLFFLPRSEHGLINEFLDLNIQWWIDNWFEFYIGDYLVEVPLAWIPIFLMCFWGGWGGNFIIICAGLQNVPKNLYEACSIDGCSGFRKHMAVTVPGIKGQLVLCLFTTIIGYLGLYGQNFVLSNGGPASASYSSFPGGGKTSTAIYFIQDIAANNVNFRARWYGLAAAAALVFACMVAIISGIQMWATREKKSGHKKEKEYSLWQQAK